MTGISQAVAGLQALTVGENIRTGRTPLSQMGAQIGEVGQSFAPVDKANAASKEPNHFPKINPASKRIGLANPNNNVHITVKIKNRIPESKILEFFISIK